MLHSTPARFVRSMPAVRLAALSAAAMGCLPLASQAGSITPGARYPTADEQYTLQLINHARTSADGLSVLHTLVSNDLNAITASSTGTAQDGTPWSAGFWTSAIPGVADAMNFFHVHPGDLKKQYQDLVLAGYPLAWNVNLGNVASGYDDLVLANRGAGPGFPHNLAPYADASTFMAYAQRYLDGGYGPLSDISSLAENIEANSYSSAQSRFAGFMIDWGNTPDGIQDQNPDVGSHRLTLMDDQSAEIGIAAKAGWDSGNASEVQELGERFSPPPALVGAVYVDMDHNGFYTPGEGVAGATVNAAPNGGGTTLHARTFRSGGYVLPISKPGNYTLSVTGTFGTVNAGTVNMGSANVARDIVCPKGQQPADFNGDNKPDYLVAYPSTGRSIIWYLNGGAWAGQADGPTIPVGWTVVGVADFNGDGFPDYLLYHPSYRRTIMYYLHGSAYVGQANGPTINTGYTLVGFEDFNRDGQTDYLLYNTSSRQTVIWYLNGTNQTGNANGPILPAGWVVAGVSDLNSDGCPDLALYNSTTQQTQIWYLNDAKKIGQTDGPTILAGWSLVGVADFDANGHPDFVIYQDSTRQTQIMFLQGTALVKTQKSQTIPANWKLISP